MSVDTTFYLLEGAIAVLFLLMILRFILIVRESKDGEDAK